MCLYSPVTDHSRKRPRGRLEAAIWYGLLNDSFQAFGAELEARQAPRRDMQRAWIAARDSTCTFYDV